MRTKTCQYRIHLVVNGVDEYDFHYDTAIEAVHAWDKFRDHGGDKTRTLTFMGAAGEMAFKQFKDPSVTE